MPSIRLNEDELTALFGLPHLAIVLYLLGLRPRVDFRTGLIGIRPLISWQALREAVYVEPHPGTKHVYAKVNAVRRAAGWLEKAGLIRMQSHDRQLIFFLPLADRDQSVQKKAGRGPADQADRPPVAANPHGSRVSGALDGLSRQSKNQQAGRHPYTSVNYVNTSSSLPSSKNSGCQNGEEEGEEKLIFPATLTTRQQAAIAKKLAGVYPDMAQAVLDELAGAMQATEVRSVPRLLQYFLDQVESGDFIPDKGEKIWRAREAQKRAIAQRAEAQRRAQEAAVTTVKGSGKPDNLLALVGSRKARNKEREPA